MANLCACGCGQSTNSTYIRGHHWKMRSGETDSDPNPSGICMCGCGHVTPIASRTMRLQHMYEGKHLRYCHGHQNRKHMNFADPNPSGECGCGCREQVALADRSDPSIGLVMGKHRKYKKNHHGRKTPYSIEDRGWKTPCWIWRKATDKNGYGNHSVDHKPVRAHRHYCTVAHGPIPKGWEVDHLCHVTSCVNPDHLEAVPPIINQRRKRTTKLSVQIAFDIRQMKKSGLSAPSIAAHFGVNVACVHSVIQGRTWVAP